MKQKVTAKTKNNWIVHLLLALILVAAGIFILVRTDMFKQIFIIALGIVAIVTGIISLVTMGRYSFGRFNRGTTLAKGILGIVVGVLAVVMPLATAETVWTVLIYVLGVLMLYSAVVEFVDAAAIRKSGFPVAPMVSEGAFSLVFAVILFVFPRDIADLVVTILGIAVIAAGVTFGALALHARKVSSETVEEVEVEMIDQS